MNLFIKKNKKDKDGKWNEVDSILTEVVATPMSREEVGGSCVGLAEVYLDRMNILLDSYKKTLEVTLANLDTLDGYEKKFNDKMSLAKIRASLRGSK